MNNKFTGIAYWSVKADADWASKAAAFLQSTEDAGLAEIGYECTKAGDHVLVTLAGEKHELLINRGEGRGVVRGGQTAGVFVACLLGLRRELGGIEVIDDIQEALPSRPRRNHPLFEGCWDAVEAIMVPLRLAPNKEIMARFKRYAF